MADHGVLADFKDTSGIPNAIAIHRHFADLGFDLRQMTSVSVIAQKTLLTSITTVSLCAFFRSAMAFNGFNLATLGTFYCFKYHDAKLRNHQI
jgi:hypothetical protein